MMDRTAIKQEIGRTLLSLTESMEQGNFGPKIRVGLTTLGSELEPIHLVKGAEEAVRRSTDLEVVLIGPKVETALETVEVNEEAEMHKVMERMLDEGKIQACVTMHYNFPIGVATVGKVVTPGLGREMFVATTTGTADTQRAAAMVKNALYGIITAKAMGIEKPTVGILNLDSARQVERALNTLKSNGYEINFSESVRSDGGSIMRGNDLLTGSADVMVTDSLTGNIMMKVFSSYTTGGSYEALGAGYGPGIGEGQQRVVLILSRASGTPVVANALQYAASLVKGNVQTLMADELEKAKKAGLESILEGLQKDSKKEKATEEEIKAPPKEIVTGNISGIEVMDIDDAVQVLWKEGIYAESGMGCTGPVVMVAEDKVPKSVEILAKAGYVAGEGDVC
ncbi:glycine/sarcosine/betaine reductase complex component C subunit alpha [Tindallia californiensis]|uniref:Fatty acid/phospholipid biosynthesis enzyme n=1 Tax=Tindallia californiensis TaxID=159292 RepID=A0A1H3Q361_9FIRM|nr:glycine/sarcosine/betaine reductase complex component C subunit alpha [Tindallia californiensis]SDZ07826.1 Fatty acid/phospholipid biosynthesis enzyme [Tindallia californiensis]